MAKISLFNRGKRTIHGAHADGSKFAFKPNAIGRFDHDQANKLRRLFPLELQSLEDMHKQFEASVPRDEAEDNAAPSAAHLVPAAEEKSEASAEHDADDAE